MNEQALDKVSKKADIAKIGPLTDSVKKKSKM